MNIIYIESEFQHRLATQLSGHNKIINCKIVFGGFIFLTVHMLYHMALKHTIIVHDHRNKLVLVAAFLVSIFRGIGNRFFIGDDGMHSLMVDRYGVKYLLYNTFGLKTIFLKKYSKIITNMKRFHSIKDLRPITPEGSRFNNYYENISVGNEKITYDTLFIDQPTMLERMNCEELDQFRENIANFSSMAILLHPRRTTSNVYKNICARQIKFENTEAALKGTTQPVTLIGFFSTLFLSAIHFGHNVTILPVPAGISELEKEYIDHCIAELNL